MGELKIVSLFSGTGALDLAITAATGAKTVAVADVCGDPKTKNWPHKTPCASPCTILEHHFPGIPNLGDVSTVDWRAFLKTLSLGDLLILCAGFPCQDVSTAGKRAGLKDGTRTGLWSEVVRAIRELKPKLVILENVPGIFTAPAAGDVEPCEVCLGDRADEHLRALHAVLADLAEIGFDAEWIVIPASGVGAPHQRLRWVLAAYPAGSPWRLDFGDGLTAANAESDGWNEGRAEPARLVGRLDAAERSDTHLACWCDEGYASGACPLHHFGALTSVQRNSPEIALLKTPTTQLAVNGGSQHPAKRKGGGHGPTLADEVEHLMPTPRASDGTGIGLHGTGGMDLRTAVTLLGTPTARMHKGSGPVYGPNLGEALSLLPTPAVNDMGRAYTPQEWDAWTDKMRAAHANGNGHGKSLEIEAARLLPTPAVADTQGGRKARSGERGDELLLNGLAAQQRFGEYGAAIARWEAVIGRPAPDPTGPTETYLKMLARRKAGKDVRPAGMRGSLTPAYRLSPRFTEWMMGLPDGWITDVPGMSRNEALKACGNGVVPQQIYAALQILLARIEVAA